MLCGRNRNLLFFVYDSRKNVFACTDFFFKWIFESCDLIYNRRKYESNFLKVFSNP